jgi:mannose-6-phosphate isomerase-like protein (cupin superfamily)
MRKIAIVSAFVVLSGLTAGSPLWAQAPSGEQRVKTLEPAPKDHSIAIPKEKLASYLREMDATKLQTLRLIEGGKYNVNIRRITAAESALVHPVTADLWVVLEGGGTLTTGGVLEAGKINGGQTRHVKAGDVVYIPSGLPHGVSGVDGNITWLNVRWDTDWPADSPMGAGTLRGLVGNSAGPAAAPRNANLPAGSQQALPFSYGGSGEMFFAKETLEQIMAGMRLRKSINTRLIEGGRYNINLRWNETPTAEVHEQTIDTWFVLAGGATVNTGFEVKDGKRVADTGMSSTASPGDVFFHPSNHRHGFSVVSPDIFWLNIRWDDNYSKAP